MDLARTEMTHEAAKGFDTLPAAEAALILARAQAEAAAAVAEAAGAIAEAAERAAGRLLAGGRLVYAAAGSSGLMALADALELPGTYGIGRERVAVLLAGGAAALEAMTGGPEDDADAGRAAVAAAGIGPADCLVAITASGATPYALAAAEAARVRGAATIGVANNAEAPLFGLVETGICLRTPPEVIAGSTRMGAGTAQKIALNTFSTLVATHLGHVHDGYMVNLVADNGKLRRRAQRIVMAVASVPEEAAAEALAAAGGAVKPAVLLAAGARDLAEATRRLETAKGHLRAALDGLG